MNIDLLTLAEVVGIAALVVGGLLVASYGGALFAVGVVLLYEARA